MKKTTIFIILIVFVVSVFVVGMFGIKNPPYNEAVYATKVEVDEVSIDDDLHSLMEQDDGSFIVMVKEAYKTGEHTLRVDYHVNPSNVSNNRVSIVLGCDSSVAEIDDFGFIKIHKPQNFTVTLYAADRGTIKTELIIWFD